MKKRTVFVQIAGGLGNQLFQLAAALNISNSDDDLKLVTNLASVRRTSNLADLLHLNLPPNVSEFEILNTNPIIRRMANLGTRLSAWELKQPGSKLIHRIYSILLKIVFSIFLRQRIQFEIASGVGLSKFGKSRKNRSVFLLGYFQSYKYFETEQELSRLQKLFDDVNWSEEVQSHVRGSISRLIIHIRMTDYFVHPQFGVLDMNYYKNALDYLLKREHFDEIWAFSDDILRAKQRFASINMPEDLLANLKWMETNSLTSFETLQIMRHGSSYILANSTFGWWSAMLSKSAHPTVVVPSPWFSNNAEPHEMHPKSWIRLLR